MKKRILIILGIMMMFIVSCGGKHPAVKDFEETMKSASPCIDRSYACWSKNNIFLLCCLSNITQKGALSCACLSC